MKLISEEREDGNLYHDEEHGCSVFEWTECDPARFCAWEGVVDDYGSSARTPWADSIEEAVEFLAHQHFRCEKCGKSRSRKAHKKWSDSCKGGGTHVWEAVPPKKKHQSGRKINIWFSDTQLQEMEVVSDETGNDRASTIRDLVSLGLKFRRQLDNLAGLAEKPAPAQSKDDSDED